MCLVRKAGRLIGSGALLWRCRGVMFGDSVSQFIQYHLLLCGISCPRRWRGYGDFMRELFVDHQDNTTETCHLRSVVCGIDSLRLSSLMIRRQILVQRSMRWRDSSRSSLLRNFLFWLGDRVVRGVEKCRDRQCRMARLIHENVCRRVRARNSIIESLVGNSSQKASHDK